MPRRAVTKRMVRIGSVLLLLLGRLSPAGHASFPGSNGRIAFQSNPDGNWEIYAMNADGTDLTNLTNHPAEDFYPAWSPDGSRIAFSSNRDGNAEIYLMNVDGTSPTRITYTNRTDVFPAWSPDGLRIAFASYDLGTSNYDIWSMNADGTGQKRLTTTQSEDTEPAWSPDGSRILFRSSRDGNLEIYVMNSNGTGATNLTNDPTTGDDAPDWSPDGTKIVFARTRDQHTNIWLMNADGTMPTQLTDSFGGDSMPAWSPDGSKIVFTSFRDFNHEIYAMKADGTDQTRLTNNAPPGQSIPEDFFADWQSVSTSPLPITRLWLGLKSDEDQGTRFDVRAALYLNDALVTEGETRCITNVRPMVREEEVLFPLATVADAEVHPSDMLTLKILTRIGTNPDGSQCPGRSSATGLRLYYDGANRPSRLTVGIRPEPWTDHFMRSSSSAFFLDATPPTSPTAKQKDSGPVNFAGGNPWVAIGAWSRVVR